MKLDRRDLLAGAIAAVSAPTAAAEGRPRVGFNHGVASGDPQDSEIVLWTRVTTEQPSAHVTLEVATDLDFARVMRRESFSTDSRVDFTVKVLVGDLQPGTAYFYRFICGSVTSPTGRTRTLAHDPDKVRLALVSCANYQRGFFHAYREIATTQGIDVVVHLGDYIYEHGVDHDTSAFTEASGRYHDPPQACVTLSDYRRRYAQYRSDQITQQMHAAHPMIAIWDDHEIANDAWHGGSPVHNAKRDGPWVDRRDAAMRAYYEWMPVKNPGPALRQHDRFGSFVWKNFLTLATLETRLGARSRPLGYSEIASIAEGGNDGLRHARALIRDGQRHLVSAQQLKFLETVLQKSVANGEPWRLLANQVMMAEARSPRLAAFKTKQQQVAPDWPESYTRYTEFDLPYSLDAWGGYPAARAALCDHILSAGVRDLLVLTGDSHQTWANDLYCQNEVMFGVEVGVTAVASPHWLKFMGAQKAEYSLEIARLNRSIRYHDAGLRGFTILTLSRNAGLVEHIGIDSVENQGYVAGIVSAFRLARVGGSLQYIAGSGLDGAQMAAFEK